MYSLIFWFVVLNGRGNLGLMEDNINSMVRLANRLVGQQNFMDPFTNMD